jgi:hypothetical protein
MRLSIFVALVLVMNAGLLWLIPGAHTQSNTAFNVDDLLDVKNVSLADLSDDDRWMAVTIGSARDRIGVDNHRFGDPTYIAPSLAEVWVIEMQTAKSQKLFSDQRDAGWITEAHRKFEAETKAAIVVHSSKELFLAWDELRRMTAIRSLAAHDVMIGQTCELIAQTRFNSYDLAHADLDERGSPPLSSAHRGLVRRASEGRFEEEGGRSQGR